MLLFAVCEFHVCCCMGRVVWGVSIIIRAVHVAIEECLEEVRR